MSNASIPMTELNLGPSYGPILIGALLEAALWGMTTVQTILYFINYGSKDRWDLKAVALINFGLTSTLVVAISSAVYLPLILHFGNALQLRSYPWGIRAAGLLSALTIFHIQGFFLYRVYRFSQSFWPLVVAAPFVLATFAMGLVSDIQVISNPSRAAADAKLANITVSCEAVMAATDFLLAGLLIFYLRRREPKLTRKTPTNVVIARLIKYAIGTGALTGISEQHLLLETPFSQQFLIPIQMPCSLCNIDLLMRTFLVDILNRLNTRKLVAKPWKGEQPADDLSEVEFSEPPLSNGRTTWEDSAFHSRTKIDYQLESGILHEMGKTRSIIKKESIESSVHRK
ncbi:hypothetical protein BDZ94DRAFT_1295221 [Collybia nuda]|uniref:DUF6534 domain-containing protein n=1 Tax=Collybia nuda TaxID=64659 RepID=A0A9P5YEA0_9AGAR|nr:hypothetical protein BDZ94DRAFT_1295221 [Collybia nuda]